MSKRIVHLLAVGCASSIAWGAAIDTTDPGVIAAFQSGATVISFESLAGITPLSLNSFADDTPVPDSALLLQQLQPGGGIAVTSGAGIGGVVLNLEPPIDTAAVSGTHVLGSAFNPGGLNGPQSTCFLTGCFLELFFEVGVNRVGFWTNANVTVLASSGDVTGVLALNTVLLENAAGTAGRFVGIERPTDEINFVQIFAGGNDFVIDDLTYGRVGTAIPEPAALTLFGLAGLAALAWRVRPRSAARG